MLCIIISAFFLGSLWTKVQLFEKTGVFTDHATITPTANPTFAPAISVPNIQKNDHVRGNPKARIILVEYSDLECQYCKEFHPVAKQILNAYKNDVMWVYRQYPSLFHKNALKEAVASECVASLAGNDAFWKFIDTIYEQTTSNGTGFAVDKLAPLAQDVGVSSEAFQACLDNSEFTQKVTDESNLGSREGVTGTPGIIITDTKTGKTQLIPGALGFDTMKSIIDGMMKQK
jgi:protein-disulfide isomerase